MFEKYKLNNLFNKTSNVFNLVDISLFWLSIKPVS